MSTPWWRLPFRTFQTNLREVDADLDVEAVLDTIVDYGADTWLLNVGGVVANYPSDLDSQTVNPYLTRRAGGDLVGDAVSAARRRGVRVLARMDFSKIDAARAEQHPEWCFVDAAGAPQVYNGLISTCPSGPYYQEEMFRTVAEVLQRYEISGFFVNMMSFNERDYSRRYRGVCHCEPCRRGFGRHAPGVELPTGPDSPSYPAWQQYTAVVLGSLNSRMRSHLKQLRPQAALILGPQSDITFYEANNAVGRQLWHHATAEAVSAARAVDPDRPVLVNSVGFVDMPYRWAGEDPHRFAQYLLQAMSRGAQPSTYVMGRGYDCGHLALGTGSRLTTFHRDHAATYTNLRSDAQVALVRPTRTDADSLAEYRGCYLSLSERHVPFDVVGQEAVPDVDLGRFALLVLPHLGALQPAQAQAVQDFLGHGGAVAATGDSAWQDGTLQLADAVPLATQRARFSNEEALRALHLPLGDGDHAPVLGAFLALAPAPETQSDWFALGRAPYGPPEKCYGHPMTPHPGWVSGPVGAGRLGLLPWLPGLTYHQVGLQRVRDAWVDKALTLAPRLRRPVTTLPAQVEVVVGRTPTSTIVHLLNRSGDAAGRFIQPLPLGTHTLTLPASARPISVYAHVSGRELEWSLEGGDLTVSTPELDLFEVVEVHWPTTSSHD